MPFGSLVTFLPKPETLKAMPKMEPRGVRGIIVGYRLHNGGKWAHDYQVFPIRYFDEYDYSRPRSLIEIIPVTTQEVKPAAGETVFPLRERYDRFRNMPTTMLPHCVLKPVEAMDCDTFEDKPDSEDATVPGGESKKADEDEHPIGDIFAELPEDTTSAPKAAGGSKEAEDMGYHHRQDAIGRKWLYDKYGNRVYKTPLRGSLRPRSIPQKAWNKLDKETRREVSKFYEDML